MGSVRSLRYYEEQGLLTSTRSASGQRHYTDHEVEISKDRVAATGGVVLVASGVGRGRGL